MNDQVLTIEQMLKLQELGVNISKGNLLWCYPPNDSEKAELSLNTDVKALKVLEEYFGKTSDHLHTFTVMDLINLLPEEIDNNYMLSINIHGGTVSYFKYDYDDIIVRHQTCADRIIDALYEMVLLLIKKQIFKF